MREVTLEGAMAGLVPIVRSLSNFQPKLKRGVAGADSAVSVLRTWAQAQRDPARPLFWFHAPSVGEALMAQAIIRSTRKRMPNAQVVFTHLSPSAERMRNTVGADVAGYLPWDTAAAMRDAIAVLRPSAISFVRTEIWPTLTRLAHAEQIPVLLLNAVLAPGSSRLKPLARYMLRPAHERLSGVGAINPLTAERFKTLGVAPDRITVTGDARFDQVWQRISAIDANRPLLQQLRADADFVIVAGSTWPVDEQHLAPAFAALNASAPARLIIAPHETTAVHVESIEAAAKAAGLSTRRLAEIEAGAAAATVVIIDRVGVLADIYAIADVVYVGGAFHSAGVHSVVEPAALGKPVIIGPDHQNAAEAQELVDAGGGISVKNGDELRGQLLELRENHARREQAAVAAQAFVQSKLGAADANAQLLLSYL